MTLAERITAGGQQVAVCSDPYGIGCTRPAGEHICSNGTETRGFRDVPEWRKRFLKDLAERGYVAAKEIA